MKTLYIGDIHGHINVVNYVDANFPDHRKIFLGDYVDAFDRTRAEQLECVKKVIEMVEKGNTIALLGNHEISYLVEGQRCSGFARNFKDMLTWNQLPVKMWKNFQFYHFDAENKILATHAGICNYIWREHNLTVEGIEDTFFNWMRDQYYTTPLYWIGNSRGGADRVGGPLWCDWNAEFTGVEGLTQIMGHTHYVDIHREMDDGIRQRGTNYNLDCLGRVFQFLEFDDETKKFTIIEVNKELVG